MTLKDALALTLELASDNVIDPRDDAELLEEYTRQTKALEIVHDHMESLA